MNLLFLLFCNLVLAGNYFIDGPAEINFEWISDCPQYKNLPVQFTNHIHKINRSIQVLDINMSMPFDFDDSVSFAVTGERWGAGGWMKNAFNLKQSNTCSALNMILGDLWLDFQQSSGLEPGVCPMKKGNYSAQNFYVNINKMSINTFIHGRFRTTVKFFQNTKIVFCKIFLHELVEKKNM